MHVDFQAVSMDEKLTTKVPVRFVGTAPVIKEHDAMLMTELAELEVEAFPRDLPDYIEVDITVLAELGDNITVGQLSLGDKVDIRHEAAEVIVLAISAAAEEITEEPGAGVAEPEVITKGKQEEED
jgi:large subunit ribosomal protein L25